MNKAEINSFDGTEMIHAFVERPEKYSHLFKVIDNTPGCIARGAGLSYCAASVGNEITSIDMKRFNRILMIDDVHGFIKVESGISIGALINFITQRGWYFKAIPGYPSITIGGCIAFNIHGKSQFNTGTFGDHISKFTIYHPAYGELECSNSLNKDIFDLTIGGFGLTGVILDVTLELSPLQGNSIERKNTKCENLLDAIEKMTQMKDEYENVYSWNDLNISGNKFGKGIIYSEKFCQNTAIGSQNVDYKHFKSESRNKFGINSINKITANLLCFFYYRSAFIFSDTSVLNLAKSTFPIYGKELYFYLFGKQGFREYQLIIPTDKADKFSSALQQAIDKFNIPITLGSLKLFRGKGKYLNFSQDGVCIAIDVPAIAKSESFFSELDDLTIRFNGIANLSKDSRLKAKTISEMYEQYDKFRTDLQNYDPKKYFTSSLRQRLEI